MDNANLRQKAILASLAVVLLYAGAAVTWFVHSEKAWKKAARDYEKAKATYRDETRLIGQKQHWREAYESAKSEMPTFAAGKATDTKWLAAMDELALKHHILISNRQAGREVDAGDVQELPLEVKSWEGSLEALVRFMHELENTTEGMYDIRALNFKPSSKKGYLKGSFTLSCAYRREK